MKRISVLILLVVTLFVCWRASGPISPIVAQSQEIPTTSLLAPPDGARGAGLQTFSWDYGAELEPGQALELLFWPEGEDPITRGFGLASPTTGSQISVDLTKLDSRLGNLLDPGSYQWGLLVVQLDPYQRVQYLGEHRTFVYDPSAVLSATATPRATPNLTSTVSLASAPIFTSTLTTQTAQEVTATDETEVASLIATVVALEQRISTLEEVVSKLLANSGVDASIPQALNTPTPEPEPAKLEIVSIDARVTEANSTWSKFAWLLEVENKGDTDLLFEALVKFYDADGFVIDEDRAYDLVARGGETATFSDYVLIDAAVAGNVTKVGVETFRSGR